jgi:hypothetical protein
MNAAGGGRLLFPGFGNYQINAILTTITVPCEVVGMGLSTTNVVQNTANTGIFIFTQSNSSWVHGLGIIGAGVSTTNYGIQIGTASLAVSDMTIEDCLFSGFYSGIQMVQAINSTRVSGCIFGGAQYCIEVGPLSGTPMIEGNQLNPSATGSGQSGVHMNKCPNGGYLIVGNYFDGGDHAILYECPNAPDLDMWVVGNHIEDYAVSAIQFVSPTSAGVCQLANIVIVGNEFADSVSTSLGPIQTSTTSAAGVWIQRITITGNVIVSSTGTSGVSLYFAEFGCISGNSFGLHGTAPGIFVDVSCNNIEVCPTSNAFGFGTVFVTDNQTRTVATLQAASAFRGKRTYVTNSNATLAAGIGATVAAGGANIVPVFSDGTNWKIG